ncbi:SH3 domain-containing protein [Candidatus Roizmanbacteria bacterium]|nr:SH3 domain-containing protein [Candidatus Roizmanbacteria bacterium]
MKNPKLFVTISAVFIVLVLIGNLNSVSAYNEYQKCDKDTTCTVGEFLYDDSYDPISSAECRLTSRYPNGDIFINGDLMDSETDGWYSYAVEATGAAGLYRSQVCCLAGSDYLCLDKSFKIEATTSALTKTDVANAVWDEPRASHTQSGSFGQALQNIVPSASDIALAVWGYSGRTLSNFGSLPSDIWNYTTRTMTSFGDLIANIWNSSNRTLTSGGSTSTTNNTTNNYTVDTSSFAKKSDVDSLKNEVLYNQSLLEKLANKPVIKNFLEEEPDVNLESKLNQSQLLLTKLFADSYSMDSKLGMIDIKWKDLEGKKIGLVLKEVADLNLSIADNAKKISGFWNLPVAENINTQAEALKGRVAMIQTELRVDEKSKMALEDINSLNYSLDSFIDTLGSAKDAPGKETLYGKINEIKQLADTFDLYSSDADRLLADWKKYQLSDIQKKTNVMAENLAKVNRLPKSITIISSLPEDSLAKKLKNRILSIKATIDANKKLLAKKSSKPFSNSWLEEGSVIFKTLLTNPSTRISQAVPLKYYLPAEIKKEDIISFDEGLKVNYDVEKKQLYVEGEFTLAPYDSKVVSVRVQDIWAISTESIESLRRQAEELSKPLAKTAFFGQGVTIKSNIDVALDKILADQKSAITPEAKIKNYYEAQISLKSVRDQIDKLQDLVTQSGSFSSMAGFVGGAQAVAVWGLIIIMVAGFVFLVIYMRVLRPKEMLTEKPKTKKKKQLKILPKNEIGHGLGRGELIRFASIFFVLGSLVSFLTSFAVFKAVTYNQNPVKVIAQTEEKTISPIPDNVLGVTEEKPPVFVTVIDLKGDILRIRETPQGKVISEAKTGDKFTFVKETDGWTQIELTDGTGWVSSEFISKNE